MSNPNHPLLRVALQLLLLAALVAAGFFVGRASSIRRAERAEKQHRELQQQMLLRMGFRLYSDEFAEQLLPRMSGLNDRREDHDYSETISLLRSVGVHLRRLPKLPQESKDGYKARVYVLSPTYCLKVGGNDGGAWYGDFRVQEFERGRDQGAADYLLRRESTDVAVKGK